MTSRILVSLAATSAIALMGCPSPNNNDAGTDVRPGTCSARTTVNVAPTGTDSTTVLRNALLNANACTDIVLADGTYTIRGGQLTLGTPNVTIRGQTQAGTIIDFGQQVLPGPGMTDSGTMTEADSMVVTADHFVLENLTVKNSPGNGIVIRQAEDVTVRRVTVKWDRGPSVMNGAYAVYPIGCRKVLVENCEVTDAADAGIYVGQSTDVIVRNNRVSKNVAGIEIENCTRSDVYSNETFDNTAGILVFALPNLPKKDCIQTRVYMNNMHDNNRANFARSGTVVAGVPDGLGMMILAAQQIEIFGNTFNNNNSTGVVMVNYKATGLAQSDAMYKIYANFVHIHENTFTNNGTSPSSASNFVGLAGSDHDIVWDGELDPSVMGDRQKMLCLGTSATSNGAAVYYSPGVTFDTMGVPSNFTPTMDKTPHLCGSPVLTAVTPWF